MWLRWGQWDERDPGECEVPHGRSDHWTRHVINGHDTGTEKWLTRSTVENHRSTASYKFEEHCQPQFIAEAKGWQFSQLTVLQPVAVVGVASLVHFSFWLTTFPDWSGNETMHWPAFNLLLLISTYILHYSRLYLSCSSQLYSRVELHYRMTQLMCKYWKEMVLPYLPSGLYLMSYTGRLKLKWCSTTFLCRFTNRALPSESAVYGRRNVV